MPWSSRYSSRASSGVSVRARSPRPELRFLVGERGHAEARREPRFALDLDDQHAHARRGRPRWPARRSRSSCRRRPCPPRSRPGRPSRSARGPWPHATGVPIARRPCRRSRRRHVARSSRVAIVVACRSRSTARGRGARRRPASAASTSCRSRATSTRRTQSLDARRDRGGEQAPARTLLVLQVKSNGRDRRRRRKRSCARSSGREVPVVVWVGPSGADAKGAATAPAAGRAPRLHLAGTRAPAPANPVQLDDPDATHACRSSPTELAALAERNTAAIPTARAGSASERLGRPRPHAAQARPTACARPSASSSCGSTARPSPPRPATSSCRPPR